MRKLIKKYLWGGLNTPTYAHTYNSSSDFYNNVMDSNIGNSFTNSVQLQLGFYSKLGDKTALSLLTNLNLSLGIKGIGNKITSGATNAVSGAASSAASGAAGGAGGKAGMSSGLSAGLGVAGLLLGSISDVVPTLDKVHNSNDLLSSDIRGGVNKALLSGVAGPWGMLAGAINMGIDKTGGFTDTSKGLGGANDALNMVASLAIPGAGWFTKKTRNYKVSNTLKLSADSYGGTLDKANTAAQNAGAKILFGKGKANSMIGDAILADTKVKNITLENEIAQAGANNPFIAMRTLNRYNGGFNNVSVGKSGLKLPTKQLILKVKDILSNKSTMSFKQGGKMNVIPEGALHARLHHMDVDGITKKGIPVITKEDGGEIIQHAEIERDEIIFTKEVTEKLEELYKKGTDEAAIEAGKILAREIMENTLDNTGLMNTIS